MAGGADLSAVEHVPSMVDGDKYAIHNDPFIIKEGILKQEIVAQSEGMEEWQISATKLIFLGKGVDASAKIVKKRAKLVRDYSKSGPHEALLFRLNTLKRHQEGPTKDMRRNMLWRMAVDNQEDDPKESIKALSEISKMDDVKEGGSGSGFGTINVVISSDVLKKGPLDE